MTHFYQPGIGGVGNAMNVWTFPDVTPEPVRIVSAPLAIPAVPGAGILMLGAALAAVGMAIAADPRRSRPPKEPAF